MPEHKPKLAEWDVADLQAAAYNPRKISRSRFEDLKRSMKADPDFLRIRPIIVNVNPERRGVVIGGHMRLEAAKELGYKTVPVIEVHATTEQEKAWNLKDNSHHGEWDRDKLAELIIPEPLTFEHAMPSDLLDSVIDEYGPNGPEAKATEEDQVDEIAGGKNHITQPGDVWQLGDHVLTCGDSTEAATFERIMGGEKAAMTFTDPPYNVDYSTKVGKVENDKMTDSAWARFVRAYLTQIREWTNGAVYVCMSTKEWPSLHAAFIEMGFHWSTTVMWIKDAFTLGRSDYQRQHEPIMVGKTMKAAKAEPILYGWPKGVDKKWNGGRDEGDAWFFKRPRSNPIHPTQKPVELVARAIANSSSRGDTVLDCFAGGGVNAYRLREDRQKGTARRVGARILRRDRCAVRRPHQERQAEAERKGPRVERPRHHDRGRSRLAGLRISL